MKKVILILSLLVIAGAAVYAGARYFGFNKKTTEAPKGELVSTLPPSVKFFDSNAEVLSSSAKEVGTQNQTLESSGTFKTSKTIEQVYNESIAYLEGGNYTVVNKTLDKVNGATVYGTSAESDISILILQADDGQTEVRVTHLAAKK
jgi:hypothetical protein